MTIIFFISILFDQVFGVKELIKLKVNLQIADQLL